MSKTPQQLYNEGFTEDYVEGYMKLKVENDKLQQRYGKAFQVIKSLLDEDAYQMFVTEMDDFRKMQDEV